MVCKLKGKEKLNNHSSNWNDRIVTFAISFSLCWCIFGRHNFWFIVSEDRGVLGPWHKAKPKDLVPAKANWSTDVLRWSCTLEHSANAEADGKLTADCTVKVLSHYVYALGIFTPSPIHLYWSLNNGQIQACISYFGSIFSRLWRTYKFVQLCSTLLVCFITMFDITLPDYKLVSFQFTRGVTSHSFSGTITGQFCWKETYCHCTFLESK